MAVLGGDGSDVEYSDVSREPSLSPAPIAAEKRKGKKQRRESVGDVGAGLEDEEALALRLLQGQ